MHWLYMLTPSTTVPPAHYASSALQGLATDIAAAQFFCQQLVQQLHPGQIIIPTFLKVLPDEKQLPYQKNAGARRRTWKDRVTTLQALVRTMRTDHQDRGFCWFVEGGKDLHTYSGAGPRMDNIFDQPGWDQAVQQRIRGAGVPVLHNVSTATAEAARPAARMKRPAQQAPAEDIDSRPAPRQRRKLQPTSVIAPGSSEWYCRKLSADPAAYSQLHHHQLSLLQRLWCQSDHQPRHGHTHTRLMIRSSSPPRSLSSFGVVVILTNPAVITQRLSSHSFAKAQLMA